MWVLKRSTVDAAACSEFAPQLLRFFHLFVGEPAAAESLTIDTLAEYGPADGACVASGLPVALLRCAVKKAVHAPEPNTVSEDCIVRAVRSLPVPQRTVVVLFRGLGLSLYEVGDVTGISLAEVKRLCAQGLLGVHQFLLTAPTQTAVHGSGSQTGEFS